MADHLTQRDEERSGVAENPAPQRRIARGDTTGFIKQSFFDSTAGCDASPLRNAHRKFGNLQSTPRANEFIWVDFAFVIVLSLTCGVSYHELFYRVHGDLLWFFRIGVLVAIAYCAGYRLLQSGEAMIVANRTEKRLRHTVLAWLSAFSLLIFTIFAFRASASVSRGYIALFFLVGLPITILLPTIKRKVVDGVFSNHRAALRAAIIMADLAEREVPSLANELCRMGYSEPIILLFDAAVAADTWQHEKQLLIKLTLESAHRLSAGDIFLVQGRIANDRFKAIQHGISIVPRAVYVIPNSQLARLLNNPVSRIGNLVSIEVQNEPLNGSARAIKRAFEIFASAGLLLLFLPLFAIITAAVKLDSRGPVLFRQTRNGFCGRPFRIFKFRSMRVLEDGQDVLQAKRNDPRVTRVGAWLRRTSLDELPQLLNVFLGEMSLVGPRPHALAHDEFYSNLIENYYVRQHVKPGMTGWAQINGFRGETEHIDQMYRRIEFDLWYARHCTLLLDIKILLRTAGAVLKQRNAH